jgi:hypothetical protein
VDANWAEVGEDEDGGKGGDCAIGDVCREEVDCEEGCAA